MPRARAKPRKQHHLWRATAQPEPVKLAFGREAAVERASPILLIRIRTGQRLQQYSTI